MKQDLPIQIQTKLGRPLVRKERMNIQRHPERKEPDKTLESYLKNLEITHQRKQLLLQSIPIYAHLLDETRVYLQTNEPIPRIREHDIFEQASMTFLEQHIYSKKVFLGLHIRYFGYQLCCLFRDPNQIYVSIYQPIAEIEQDFLDLYSQETVETFQTKIQKAFRKHKFTFLGAYSIF